MGGAESGAVGAQTDPQTTPQTSSDTSSTDPTLEAVIRAWPGLAETVKAGILAVVRAGVEGQGTGDAGNSDTHVGGAQPGGAS